MLETEEKRSVGVEPARVTGAVGSARASSPHTNPGLDWQSFSAAHFPGRRRHDLEALTAYGAYRFAQALDAGSGDGLGSPESP